MQKPRGKKMFPALKQMLVEQGESGESGCRGKWGPERY